ncbi:hypothetical protein B0H67DRAFT_565529 [Lasiosphaeris hirsuta]|uniref:RING-type E3 ubiquitin transferase n=1 Tax=Lasiosphaeris hirsuta TaxID=260670 RepID=A0AA40BD18_9PEZI|nr:hypothetical protein B0H67DRAFT_565529 [Lasiosphaeris hirsuta]
MATPNGGGQSSQAPIDVSSDSESSSSSAGSGSSGPRSAVCRFRNMQFHDLECSRYFDCPSHVIERALSDGGEDGEGDAIVHSNDEAERHEAVGIQFAAARADVGGPSPPSIDRGDQEEQSSPTTAPLPESPLAGDAEPPLPVAGSSNVATHGSPTATTPAEEFGPPVQEGPPAGSAENPIIVVDNPPEHNQRQEPNNASRRESGGVNADNAEPSLPRFNSASPITPFVREPEPGPRATQRILSEEAALYPYRLPTSPLGEHTQVPVVMPGVPASADLVLPRWQPDAEVTYCPICHAQFNIFVRKHHCRKCGRVVCNACSPHRITIPYQYIVQPPGTPRILAPRYPSSMLIGDGGYLDFGIVGGGERVRLCNPCVPDPNITPPQTQGTHSRSHSSLLQSAQPEAATPSPNRWSSYFGAAHATDAHVRSRSVTMQSGIPPSSRALGNVSQHPQSTEDRILSGTPPAYYRPGGSSQRHHPYTGTATRYRSLLDAGSSSSAAGSSSGVNRRLPPLPPPPPQIAEEDECPVCHRELPPRSLPNFEALREAHITICITSHSTYSGGVPSTSTDPNGSGTGNGPPLPPMPPRRTGMFPYTATEKDCVDSAECTICLEEFEVGVAMARLECLCRFHRMCISAWWERHPGRCPMHQHDSFGY